MSPPSCTSTHQPLWRLPASLVELILAEFRRPVPEGLGRVASHNELQGRLKALGAALGYRARLEHPTPRILSGRTGRVDVVWDALDGGRSIAFEIDRCWRRKSITKLMYMAETHSPVWIFIGARALPFTAEECDLNRIHLIEPRRGGSRQQTALGVEIAERPQPVAA